MITFESEHGLLKDIGEPAGTRGRLRRPPPRGDARAHRERLASARRLAPDLARMLGPRGRAEDRATLLALRKLIQVERRRGLDIDTDIDAP